MYTLEKRHERGDLIEAYIKLLLAKKTLNAGLPRSGKKVWKMKFFPGQGKVREFQF